MKSCMDGMKNIYNSGSDCEEIIYDGGTTLMQGLYIENVSSGNNYGSNSASGLTFNNYLLYNQDVNLQYGQSLFIVSSESSDNVNDPLYACLSDVMRFPPEEFTISESSIPFTIISSDINNTQPSRSLYLISPYDTSNINNLTSDGWLKLYNSKIMTTGPIINLQSDTVAITQPTTILNFHDKNELGTAIINTDAQNNVNMGILYEEVVNSNGSFRTGFFGYNASNERFMFLQDNSRLMNASTQQLSTDGTMHIYQLRVGQIISDNTNMQILGNNNSLYIGDTNSNFNIVHFNTNEINMKVGSSILYLKNNVMYPSSPNYNLGSINDYFSDIYIKNVHTNSLSTLFNTNIQVNNTLNVSVTDELGNKITGVNVIGKVEINNTDINGIALNIGNGISNIRNLNIDGNLDITGETFIENNLSITNGSILMNEGNLTMDNGVLYVTNSDSSGNLLTAVNVTGKMQISNTNVSDVALHVVDGETILQKLTVNGTMNANGITNFNAMVNVNNGITINSLLQLTNINKTVILTNGISEFSNSQGYAIIVNVGAVKLYTLEMEGISTFNDISTFNQTVYISTGLLDAMNITGNVNINGNFNILQGVANVLNMNVDGNLAVSGTLSFGTLSLNNLSILNDVDIINGTLSATNSVNGILSTAIDVIGKIEINNTDLNGVALNISNGIANIKSLNISGNMSATGNSTIQGNEIIYGNVDIMSGSNFELHNGVMNLINRDSNNLYLTVANLFGCLEINNTNPNDYALKINSGNVLMNDCIITGKQTITNLNDNALEVNGISNFNNNVNVYGNTGLYGTLNIDAVSTAINILNGISQFKNVNVNGDATITGNLVTNGTNTISSSTTISGNLYLNLSNEFEVNISSKFDDDVYVSGNTTLNQNLNVNGSVIFSSSASMNNLNITGNEIITGSLQISNTNLNGMAINITAGSTNLLNTNITGTEIITGTLEISNNGTNGVALNILYGSTQLKGTYINGSINVSNDINITGQAIMPNITTTTINATTVNSNNIKLNNATLRRLAYIDSNLNIVSMSNTLVENMVIVGDANGLIKSSVISNDTLNYLNGLQGNVQGLLNTKQEIINQFSRLNASYVGNGNVDNDHYSYLANVTSDIQLQFLAKQNVLSTINRLNTLYIGNGDINDTKLSYLANVTSDIQSQFLAKQGIISSISPLNALLIGNGNVDNDHYSYLANVTSDIQSQFLSKQNVLSTINRLNASYIGNGDINNTKLSYLANVNGDIQSQFDLKQNVISSLSTINALYIGNGNVNNAEFSSLSSITGNIQELLNLKQNIIGPSNLVNASYIGDGNISNITLSYLENINGDIQSQIDSKQDNIYNIVADELMPNSNYNNIFLRNDATDQYIKYGNTTNSQNFYMDIFSTDYANYSLQIAYEPLFGSHISSNNFLKLSSQLGVNFLSNVFTYSLLNGSIIFSIDESGITSFPNINSQINAFDNLEMNNVDSSMNSQTIYFLTNDFYDQQNPKLKMGTESKSDGDSYLTHNGEGNLIISCINNVSDIVVNNSVIINNSIDDPNLTISNDAEGTIFTSPLKLSFDTDIVLSKLNAGLIYVDGNKKIQNVSNLNGLLKNSNGVLSFESLNLNDLDFNLNPNYVLISDGNGNIISSTIESSVLTGLSDIVSNIEDLLLTKQNVLSLSNLLNIEFIGDGSVNNAQFSYLANVTGDIQSQFTTKQNVLSSLNLLNASYVGDGSVNNAQFSYLANVTGDIQSQFTTKQNVISSSNLINASYIGIGDVDNTKFSYLKNLDDDIVTLLNTKQNVIDLNNKIQMEYVGAGNVTNEQLEYLMGLDSNISDQLDLINLALAGSQPTINAFNRLDSSYIADGSISNQTFEYLFGLNENIQDQFNSINTTMTGKQNIISSINLIDASHIGVGNVSNLQYGFLSNLTQDIKSSIDSLQSSINLKEDIISSTNLINAEFIGLGNVTNEKFAYLANLTEDVQSQINQALNGHWITNNNILYPTTNSNVNMVRNDALTIDSYLKLGNILTNNTASAYISLADSIYSEYGLHIIRKNNLESQIIHRGISDFSFITTENAHIKFNINNENQITVSKGNVLVYGSMNVTGLLSTAGITMTGVLQSNSNITTTGGITIGTNLSVAGIANIVGATSLNNNLYVGGNSIFTGSVSFVTKIDPQYINTNTSISLTTTIMGYLIGLTDNVQNQINTLTSSKQSIIFTNNNGVIIPYSNYNYNLLRSDTIDSFIKIGNISNLTNSYIDFLDTTYNGTSSTYLYGLRIMRSNNGSSQIYHKGANQNLNIAVNDSTSNIQLMNMLNVVLKVGSNLVTVTGNMVVSGSITANSINISQTLSIVSLIVSGTTALNGLNVTGTTNIGSFSSSSIASLTTLNVSGITTLTGALNLSTKLNPVYIDAGNAGSLSSNIMGYLVNLTGNVQSQINSKQFTLFTLSSELLSNVNNYNYSIYRNDNNDMFFNIGNVTNFTNSYFAITDKTYNNYGLKILRDSSLNSSIIHRGTGTFSLIATENAPILFLSLNTLCLSISSTQMTSTTPLTISNNLTISSNSNTIDNSIVMGGTSSNSTASTFISFVDSLHTNYGLQIIRKNNLESQIIHQGSQDFSIIANDATIKFKTNNSSVLSITSLTSTFSNNVNIQGSLSSSSLSISGISTFNNTSTFNGDIYINDAMHISNNPISILGSVSISNALTIGNFLTTLGGSLIVVGLTTLGGTLAVTGVSTFNNNVNITGLTTLNGAINVSGSTTLSSSLAVSGSTTLSSSLAISGSTTLSSSLAVSGSTTLSSSLNINNGNITLSSSSLSNDVYIKIGNSTASNVSNIYFDLYDANYSSYGFRILRSNSSTNLISRGGTFNFTSFDSSNINFYLSNTNYFQITSTGATLYTGLTITGTTNFNSSVYITGQLVLATRLSASYVGNGDVNDTKLSYLNTTTSNVQNQINSKQSTLSSINRVSASYIGNGDVNDTKLSFLSNVTSDIQSQFATVNANIATKQTILSASNRLSASYVGNGDVNDTKLSYLNTTTSNIQIQLDNITSTMVTTNYFTLNNSIVSLNSGYAFNVPNNVTIVNAGTTSLSLTNSTIAGDITFQLGNSTVSNTSNTYINFVDNNNATNANGLQIARTSGLASMITHKGTSDFSIIAQHSASIKFLTSNTLRLTISDATTTISNDLSITKAGAINLNLSNTSSTGDVIFTLGNSTSSNNTTTKINFNDDSYTPGLQIIRTSNLNSEIIHWGSRPLKITLNGTSAEFQVFSLSENIFRVTSDGVYIGVTSDVGDLYVYNISTFYSNAEFKTGLTSKGDFTITKSGAINSNLLNTSSTGDITFKLGNSTVSNTSNTYINFIDNNNATNANGLQIARTSGLASTITHKGTSDFSLIAQHSASIKFLTTNILRLTISDTTTTISNNLAVTGTTTLTGSLILTTKLDAAYIGTGLVDNTEFDYLNGVTSSIQTQLDSKQTTLWNYAVESGTNINILSPFTSCSLNLVRTDNNTSHIELGNITNAQATYIDFADPTYTDYGLRIIRNSANQTNFLHRSSSLWVFNSQDSGILYFQMAGITMLRITSSGCDFQSGNVTITGTSTLSSDLTITKSGVINSNLLNTSSAGDITFKLGNSTVSNTSNTYINFIDNNNATNANGLQIARTSGLASTITHKGTSDFSMIAQHSASIKFLTTNILRLTISDTTTTISNNLAVTGTTTLTGSLILTTKLDAAFIGTGVVDNTEFNYLNGVTSSIQTQFSGKQSLLSDVNRLDAEYIGGGYVTSTMFDTLRNNTWNINDTFISTTGDISALYTLKQNVLSGTNFLNAAFIGTGVISNTEFDYLNGVTSSIQTQINNKQDIFFTSSSGLLNTSSNIQINNSENTSGDCTFRLNNSNVSNTTGNIYIDMYDPTYSYGLRILRSNAGISTISHKGTQDFRIIAENAASLKLSTNGTARLLIDSSGNATFTNNLTVTGTTTLTTKLDASNIGTGLISNTKFNYLDGVTSSIQTQINTKQSTLSVTNFLDAAFIGTGLISNTEFNYLDGVTSSIQTQINTKQSTLSVTNFLDAAFIGTGVISNTEFNYLDGVTSSIQTQLDSKQTTLWNYAVDSGTNTLSPFTSCSLNLVRTDNNGSHIELGNITNAQATYIDFADPTYTDYGLRIIRNSANQTNFLHRSSSLWVFNSQDSGIMNFQMTGITMFRITSSGCDFQSGNVTITGTSTLSSDLTISKSGAINSNLLNTSSTGDITFKLGNSTVSNTSNTYINFIDNNNATNANGLQIARTSGLASTITHKGTSDFSMIAQHSASIKFLTTNILRLTISDTTTTIANNLAVTGTTTLTGSLILTTRLDASYIGTGVVGNTEFNYLDGVTSSIQTQINTKQSTLSGTNFLNAAFIGTGVVDNTEFNYLNGVTSLIQTQLDTKQSTLSGTNFLDAAFIGTGVISNTEFNYLDGVTSLIQNQINTKQSTLSGTNFLNSAFIGTGVVDNTEFNYLNGVTSSIQTQLDSKQSTLSGTNFLNAAFIGTGVVDNTEFNYLNGVTSSIQTQINNKQNIFFTSSSGLLNTSSNIQIDNSANTSGDCTFRLNNSNISNTTGNIYIDMYDPTYSYGLRILRTNAGISQISHNGTSDFSIIAQHSASLNFLTTNILRLTISDTTTTISNNLAVTGTTTLTGSLILTTKLDASYIGTGVVDNTEFNYLNGVTSLIQTQLDSKQDILWDTNTGSGSNLYYLSPSTNNSLSIVRTDTNTSYIEMGNATNLIDTFIDFQTPSYPDYAFRLWRDTSGGSYILHRGTGEFAIKTLQNANLVLYTNGTSKVTISSTNTSLSTTLDVSGLSTFSAGLVSSSDVTISGAANINLNLLSTSSTTGDITFKLGNTNATNTSNTYINFVDKSNNHGLQIARTSTLTSNITHYGTGVFSMGSSSAPTVITSSGSTFGGGSPIGNIYLLSTSQVYIGGGGIQASTFSTGLTGNVRTVKCGISTTGSSWDGFAVVSDSTIGTGNCVARFHHLGASTGNTNKIIVAQFNGMTSPSATSWYLFCQNSTSSGLGGIQGNATSNSVVFATSSDIRLKKNLKMVDSVDFYDIMKNNENQVYTFNFLNDTKISTGFVAQFMDNIYPECVSKADPINEYDEHDNLVNHQYIDYGKTSVFLYGCVKECVNQIEELKEKNRQLEDTIKQLFLEINNIKGLIAH